MVNPFKKFLEAGLNLFKIGSSSSVIGVDIGSSSIKVVQLRKKGAKAILETYGAISLGPYADTEAGQVTNLPTPRLGEALADLIKESGVTTKDGALSIPSSASLIFLIEIPNKINESELSKIVPMEARKYIPIPISEVSIDWWVIPSREELNKERSDQDREFKKEILVVATRNDVVNKYQTLLQITNLQASFFEMEVFSSLRSNLKRELSSILLLEIGASKTRLSIVEYGIVRDFHTINRGARDITETLSNSLGIPFSEAEELKRESGLFGSSKYQGMAEIIKLNTDFILSGANDVVLNYEKKYNKVISKVILTGGGVLLKGFLELATDNFKSEVILGDSFSKIETPAFLENVLKDAGPEFAIATGLALRKLQ